MLPEEARWEVTKEATRLYGDSTPTGKNWVQLHKVLDLKAKSGDLTAVYDFLEKQLGVLFLAPGPAGISYEPRKKLELKEGNHHLYCRRGISDCPWHYTVSHDQHMVQRTASS